MANGATAIKSAQEFHLVVEETWVTKRFRPVDRDDLFRHIEMLMNMHSTGSFTVNIGQGSLSQCEWKEKKTSSYG